MGYGESKPTPATESGATVQLELCKENEKIIFKLCRPG